MHSSYFLSNLGLELLAEKMRQAEGYKDSETYKIYDDDNSIISALPNFHLIKGMKVDGPISQVIAHGILSWIYFAWENRFRKNIANELSVQKDDVMSDLMGDIKLLRDKIAHNFAFLDKDLKKLKVINWLKPGHIILRTKDMNKIQSLINKMEVHVLKK